MEEDKWRSTDEEKKMSFSDKCVFADPEEEQYVCCSYGLMLFVTGGASPSGNCGSVFGGHHPGNLRVHHRPAGQGRHPQKGAGGQQHCFCNGGKVTNLSAAAS